MQRRVLAMKSVKKILVPIDFSEHSRNTINAAAELSATYGAPVTLVHVHQPLNLGLPDGFMSYTPIQLSDLLAALARQLEEAKGEAQRAGAAAVDTKLLQGAVAPEIVDYAKKGDYDLIVIGTHGHTGLKHALLGSVAERVVRLAPCPVLSLRMAA
jgi:nucleotide-binding universal stress UspA family protein